MPSEGFTFFVPADYISITVTAVVRGAGGITLGTITETSGISAAVAPVFTVGATGNTFDTVTTSSAEVSTVQPSFTASGLPTPTTTYTWTFQGVTVGNTAASYNIPEGETGDLSVAIRLDNVVGFTTSNVDFGTVGSTPAVAIGPYGNTSDSVTGTVHSMNVIASGTPTPTTTYAWNFRGVTQGETSQNFTPTNGSTGPLVGQFTVENRHGDKVTEVDFGTVGNTPSFASPPSGTPSAASGSTVGDQLTIAAPQGEGTPSPTYAYAWYLDGVTVAGQNGITYASAATADAATAIVTATNRHGITTATINFGEVRENGLAPAFGNPQPSQTPSLGELNDGETARILSVNATGVPTPTITYAWTKTTSLATATIGTNSSTYAVQTSDVGATIDCLVTLTNSNGTTNASFGFGAVLPALSSPFFASGPTAEARNLTVGDVATVVGAISGNPTPTVSYTWSLDGSVIAGATSSTYTTTATGDSLLAGISASNSEGTITGTADFGSVASGWESLSTLNTEVQATNSGATLDLTGRKFLSNGSEKVSISASKSIGISGGVFASGTIATWASIGSGAYESSYTFGSGEGAIWIKPDGENAAKLVSFPAATRDKEFGASGSSDPDARHDYGIGKMDRFEVLDSGGSSVAPNDASYDGGHLDTVFLGGTFGTAVQAAFDWDETDSQIDDTRGCYLNVQASDNRAYIVPIKSVVGSATGVTFNVADGNDTIDSGGYVRVSVLGPVSASNLLAGQACLLSQDNKIRYKPRTTLGEVIIGSGTEPIFYLDRSSYDYPDTIASPGTSQVYSFHGCEMITGNSFISVTGGRKNPLCDIRNCTFKFITGTAISRICGIVTECVFDQCNSASLYCGPNTEITKNYFGSTYKDSNINVSGVPDVSYGLDWDDPSGTHQGTGFPVTIDRNFFSNPASQHGQGVSLYQGACGNAIFTNNICMNMDRVASMNFDTPGDELSGIRTDMQPSQCIIKNNLIYESEYGNPQAPWIWNSLNIAKVWDYASSGGTFFPDTTTPSGFTHEVSFNTHISTRDTPSRIGMYSGTSQFRIPTRMHNNYLQGVSVPVNDSQFPTTSTDPKPIFRQRHNMFERRCLNFSNVISDDNYMLSNQESVVRTSTDAPDFLSASSFRVQDVLTSYGTDGGEIGARYTSGHPTLANIRSINDTPSQTWWSSHVPVDVSTLPSEGTVFDPDNTDYHIDLSNTEGTVVTPTVPLTKNFAPDFTLANTQPSESLYDNGGHTANQAVGYIEMPERIWTPGTTIDFCVSANVVDLEGINKVRVSCHGSTAEVSTITKGSNGVQGYWFAMNLPAGATTGTPKVYAELIPHNGTSRVVEKEFRSLTPTYVDINVGDLTNDDISVLLGHASGSTGTDNMVLRLGAGTYYLTQQGLGTLNDKWQEVTTNGNVDVSIIPCVDTAILGRTGGTPSLRLDHTIFRGVTFDIKSAQKSKAGRATYVAFQDCNLTDTWWNQSEGGRPFGIFNGGGLSRSELQQLYFDAYSSPVREPVYEVYDSSMNSPVGGGAILYHNTTMNCSFDPQYIQLGQYTSGSTAGQAIFERGMHINKLESIGGGWRFGQRNHYNDYMTVTGVTLENGGLDTKVTFSTEDPSDSLQLDRTDIIIGRWDSSEALTTINREWVNPDQYQSVRVYGQTGSDDLGYVVAENTDWTDDISVGDRVIVCTWAHPDAFQIGRNTVAAGFTGATCDNWLIQDYRVYQDHQPMLFHSSTTAILNCVFDNCSFEQYEPDSFYSLLAQFEGLPKQFAIKNTSMPTTASLSIRNSAAEFSQADMFLIDGCFLQQIAGDAGGETIENCFVTNTVYKQAVNANGISFGTGNSILAADQYVVSNGRISKFGVPQTSVGTSTTRALSYTIAGTARSATREIGAYAVGDTANDWSDPSSPSFTGTPSASATDPEVGDRLEFENYGSTGAAPITTTFQWYDDGATIDGATGYGYVVGATGDIAAGEITHVVTASGSDYFIIDGVNQPELNFKRGIRYIFDLSDSSVTNHPFALSGVQDGSNQYTNGWSTFGTQGQAGAYAQFIPPTTATNASLWYLCQNHTGMGNRINLSSVENPTISGDIDGIVTITNSAGSTSADVSFGTIAGALTAPFFASGPTADAHDITVGDVATVVGTIGGNPTPTVSYTWSLDGSVIAGATSSTYTTTTTGSSLLAGISASNSEGTITGTADFGTVSAAPAPGGTYGSLTDLRNMIDNASAGTTLDLNGGLYTLMGSTQASALGFSADFDNTTDWNGLEVGKNLNITNGTVSFYESHTPTDAGGGLFTVPNNTNEKFIQMFDPDATDPLVRLATYPPQFDGRTTAFTVDAASFSLNSRRPGDTAVYSDLPVSGTCRMVEESGTYYLSGFEVTNQTLVADIKTMLDDIVTNESGSYSTRSEAVAGIGLIFNMNPNTIRLETVGVYSEGTSGSDEILGFTFAGETSDWTSRSSDSHYINEFNFFGRPSFGLTGATGAYYTYDDNTVTYKPASGSCSTLYLPRVSSNPYHGWKLNHSGSNTFKDITSIGAGQYISTHADDHFYQLQPGHDLKLDTVTTYMGSGVYHTAGGGTVDSSNCRFIGAGKNGFYASSNGGMIFDRCEFRGGLYTNSAIGRLNADSISSVPIGTPIPPLKVTNCYFNFDSNHGQAISAYAGSWINTDISGNVFVNLSRPVSLQWATNAEQHRFTDLSIYGGYTFDNNLVYVNQLPAKIVRGQVGLSYNGETPNIFALELSTPIAGGPTEDGKYGITGSFTSGANNNMWYVRRADGNLDNVVLKLNNNGYRIDGGTAYLTGTILEDWDYVTNQTNYLDTIDRIEAHGNKFNGSVELYRGASGPTSDTIQTVTVASTNFANNIPQMKFSRNTVIPSRDLIEEHGVTAHDFLSNLTLNVNGRSSGVGRNVSSGGPMVITDNIWARTSNLKTTHRPGLSGGYDVVDGATIADTAADGIYSLNQTLQNIKSGEDGHTIGNNTFFSYDTFAEGFVDGYSGGTIQRRNYLSNALGGTLDEIYDSNGDVGNSAGYLALWDTVLNWNSGQGTVQPNAGYSGCGIVWTNYPKFDDIVGLGYTFSDVYTPYGSITTTTINYSITHTEFGE